jgi:hypothetical protein
MCSGKRSILTPRLSLRGCFVSVDHRLHQRWTFNHFFIAVWRAKAAESVRVKRYWEIIPGNLKKAGWRCGCISSTDANARQFWVVAASVRTPDAL